MAGNLRWELRGVLPLVRRSLCTTLNARQIGPCGYKVQTYKFLSLMDAVGCISMVSVYLAVAKV